MNDPQPTAEELKARADAIYGYLKENSQELDEVCKEVLYDNLWDLYGEVK